MNLSPIIRRRVALVSAISAALLATGYAASEHNRAASLDCRAQTLESNARDMQTQNVASTNEGAASEVSTDESPLPKIRQAARDYIQEIKPSAKIDGVFTLPLGRDSGLYITGVDVTVDGQRRTIDLLTRLYSRKGGGTYWRAESLGGEQAAAMLEKASRDKAAEGTATAVIDESDDNTCMR